ncbi:phosphocholine cytidylyltransferase family protein [Bradyrhizobium sp. CB82]|uniref:phosphocholine cytidylyltransferase family protein n=1 Tax=Bradyrhizobium sp. CB82 TaxID=3039159 RepID=UPI0024B04B53|nr:phosphocholine cytidylyltransferase family protein [Bradyrhizobium sp. CB82]WFU42030.1 phosphocholine cytidylyltransferase family protein [Bradyrhizobium sp. CB82]
MKAVMLAAGRGSRLNSITDACPKSLVDVGGTPLLLRTLEALKRSSVSEVVVIVGYLHEQMSRAIRERFDEEFCRIVRNPDYSRGSGSSLRCAADHLDEDVLLMEADLLLDRRAIGRMLQVENGLAMGRFQQGGREGKITAKEGIITRMEWGDQSTPASGDWVGLTKLSGNAASFLRRRLRETEAMVEEEFQYYTTYVFELVDQFEFRAVDIDDLAWIEIDNEGDLSRARRHVAPCIDSAVEN